MKKEVNKLSPTQKGSTTRKGKASSKTSSQRNIMRKTPRNLSEKKISTLAKRYREDLENEGITYKFMRFEDWDKTTLSEIGRKFPNLSHEDQDRILDEIRDAWEKELEEHKFEEMAKWEDPKFLEKEKKRLEEKRERDIRDMREAHINQLVAYEGYTEEEAKEEQEKGEKDFGVDRYHGIDRKELDEITDLLSGHKEINEE